MQFLRLLWCVADISIIADKLKGRLNGFSDGLIDSAIKY